MERVRLTTKVFLGPVPSEFNGIIQYLLGRDVLRGQIHAKFMNGFPFYSVVPFREGSSQE